MDQQLYVQIVYGRRPVDAQNSGVFLRLCRRLDRQAQLVGLEGRSVYIGAVYVSNPVTHKGFNEL